MILEKRRAQTCPDFGFYFDKRPINVLLDNCIFNINKPQGPTSHQVVHYAKMMFEANKAGHSGTLDPNVTGVLPTGLNNATKIVTYLLLAGKEYVALMLLHADKTEDEIRKVVKDFTGEIEQMVPQKSSVKRQLRKRNIYEFDILEIKGRNVLFRVKCEAGTYVRKLIYDIGIALGTNAHMVQLIRTKVGVFDIENMTSLQEIQDAKHFLEEGNEEPMRRICHPVEFAISHMKKIYVLDSCVDAIVHGSPLKIPGVSLIDEGIKKNDKIAIMTLKGELVSTAVALMTTEEVMRNDRGSVVALERVYMSPGLYPKQPKK